MPSATEWTSRKPDRHALKDSFNRWNRKIHYYLGLYFLFFLWLFAFTGLLLNHPGWTFAEFWPNRRESSSERIIQTPHAGDDYAQARDLMRQLGITGEIETTAARANPDVLKFRVNKPGHMFEIDANFEKRRAALHRIDLNTWGMMHVMHTFTGVRLGDTRMHRNWILTTVWAMAMDVLALGLMVMVLTSIYMWWGMRKKRTLGLVVIGIGVMLCGLFAVGLTWLL